MFVTQFLKILVLIWTNKILVQVISHLKAKLINSTFRELFHFIIQTLIMRVKLKNVRKMQLLGVASARPLHVIASAHAGGNC